MAKTLTQIFNETAEAIQEKTGSLEPITAENFGEEIRNIPGGGGSNTLIVELTLTDPEHAGDGSQDLAQSSTNEEILNAFLSGKLVLFKFNEAGFSNNFILIQAYYSGQYYFNFYGDTDDNWSVIFSNDKFKFYV